MINAARLAPDVDKEFVLFLIGMRVNKPWKIHKWLPISRAMPAMIRELSEQPTLGLLHARAHFGLRNAMVVQYWESWEKLNEYANAGDKKHRPAWTEFFQKVGMSGDVGIWHETYLVKPGQVEAVYGNMPAFGLGNVFDLVPAEGPMNKASKRLANRTAAE